MPALIIPHTQLPAEPIFEAPQDQTDLRLRHLLRPYEGQPVSVGLLGVPSDQGVLQGGGRPGANQGPSAIRQQLKQYGTAYHFDRKADLSRLAIADFGDLIPSEQCEETHQRLSEAVGEIFKLGALPIVLGGGHDLTFGGVRALANATRGGVGGIALDAHFDVREVKAGVITSGTPFRNILDQIPSVKGEHFVEIGVNGLVNAKVYYDYLISKKVSLFSLAKTHQVGMDAVLEKAFHVAGQDTDKIFVSIDLDAVAQAFAPGVSAPSPEGLTPEEVGLAAYRAGLHPKVAYLDIMEMNPSFDQDGRTARLAAAIVLHFLSGLAQRPDQARTAPPLDRR